MHPDPRAPASRSSPCLRGKISPFSVPKWNENPQALHEPSWILLDPLLRAGATFYLRNIPKGELNGNSCKHPNRGQPGYRSLLEGRQISA